MSDIITHGVTEFLQVEYSTIDDVIQAQWVEIPGSNGNTWKLVTDHTGLPQNMTSGTSIIDRQISLLQALKDRLPAYTPPAWVTRWVTCHTSGCANEGVTIEAYTLSTSTFSCGGCSQPISDVADTPPGS